MQTLLSNPVLVLNRLWQPVHTCSVRRALKLLCLGHAQVVQTEGEAMYQTHDFSSWINYSLTASRNEVIHGVQVLVAVPQIIVLSAYDRLPRRDVKFTRQNVFLRDQYECQYCRKVFAEKDLNLDHVIPRDKGGKTTWDNIVTSCIRCNTRKANKLPAEANMRLSRQPAKPKWRPLYGVRQEGHSRESWKQFIQPDRGKVRLSA
ncbi:MAG: HNH endonuclease [Verrucomicrobiota bacterium JB023]|nr:HNH endonuclease [Verrucomicrobiota bacterium JB023]